MARGKIVAFTGVAVSSWLAGVVTERWSSANRTDGERSYAKSLPGCPTFGTVSAASVIPSNSVVLRDIPAEPPQHAARVSQVLISQINTLHQQPRSEPDCFPRL